MKNRYLAVWATFTLMIFSVLVAHAEVITGTISNWPESGPLQVVGDGANSVTLFWSINTIDRGFFYGSGFTGDSDVAVAAGANDISDIVDAGTLLFTSGFVGPLCDADCAANGVGHFVVSNNINTGFYAVLRIDDIVGNGTDATLNGTWWFQTDGSGNFSSVPDPDTDNDSVPDNMDYCPDTVIPESLPSRSLGIHRYALVDGDNVFDSVSPNDNSPSQIYSTTDTAGCSCTQIIAAQGLDSGHVMFGCSRGVMNDWVELVNP